MHHAMQLGEGLSPSPGEVALVSRTMGTCITIHQHLSCTLPIVQARVEGIELRIVMCGTVAFEEVYRSPGAR